MRRYICAGLVLLFCLTGCAWFKHQEDRSAEELASDGMDAFAEGSYQKSLEAFEKLKDWYPFSKYAILAELKIADAHYRLKEYDEAITAYEEFENLHPRNEAVPYVIYQIGLCHFEQMDTVDRNQSSTRRALDTFRRLIRTYPQSPYARLAEENAKTCIKSLAGHDFYVGLFYFNSKHYPAALERFRTVITQYPDVGVHREALDYIAKCEARIAETQKP